jgi:alkylation response protein AidB-like acyl-CoA dehydrogenase
MTSIQEALQEFALVETPNIPLPGAGATWRRFTTLADQASRDLSLGRLSEGHADAVAILAEAGMKPIDGAVYGVWASKSPRAVTMAERVSGGWRLSGTKEFCSGSQLVERALVTAATDEGTLLFDVATSEHVASVVAGSWPATGMAGSMSETVEFAGAVVADEFVVGPAEFYLSRPGFWFGAVGVAACWFGGAVGLVNELVKWLAAEPSEHVLVDLGMCVGALESMREVLVHAAASIDADPEDQRRQGRFHALVTRQVVHDGAQKILEWVASAGGARPLCHDADQSRRAADLYIYLSQHHGGADAAELGRELMRNQSWS